MFVTDTYAGSPSRVLWGAGHVCVQTCLRWQASSLGWRSTQQASQRTHASEFECAHTDPEEPHASFLSALSNQLQAHACA